MTVYIALLRGINVGGKHVIKMADLKRLLEDMGLRKVKTYIQSGNILFESAEEAELLEKNIEKEIVNAYGFSAAVMLRTAAELAVTVENCPYPVDSLAEGESIYVSFLSVLPTQEQIDSLPDVTSEPDEYRLIGREIFFLFRQSIRDSKLPNKLAKLGPATTRNWNTVAKLAAMAKEMGV